MDTVTQNGGHLVWIGLPLSRDADQTLRFDVINAIVQTEATKRKGRVSYLDTYFFFAGDDGGYAQYVEDETGKLVKMRADDGVHFERAAGDLIADKVVERLGERYDFTSWQDALGQRARPHRRAEEQRARAGEDGCLDGEPDTDRERRPHDGRRVSAFERDPRSRTSRPSTGRWRFSSDSRPRRLHARPGV